MCVIDTKIQIIIAGNVLQSILFLNDACYCSLTSGYKSNKKHSHEKLPFWVYPETPG